MTDPRRLIYVLSCFAAAGLAMVAAPGCERDDTSPHPLAAAPSKQTRSATADQALKHDVAWVAAAAARCSPASAAKDCAAAAKADAERVAPKALRTRGLLSDVLGQLPLKPIICAIVRTYLGGSGGASSASPDAAVSVDASASPVTARPAFDLWGGRAKVENGDASAQTADLHEVWDMERCQAAVFVHPNGAAAAPPHGITGLTRMNGYRGPARGTTAGVIEAGRGSFELDGALAQPAHVRKVGVAFFGDLAESIGPDEVLPRVDAAFLAANLSATTYVPWDTGTEALLTLRTGKAPRIAGVVGARFVQYDADAESATTCGAQMAVAMLAQTGDTGDYESSAGSGALTAIATGVARSLDLDLGTWCGDAGGTTGGGTGGGTGASTSCHAKDPGFCGSLSCTPNGDGVVCCRSEPSGTEACPTGNDAECAAGYVCSIKRKPVAEGEPTQVCTRREACQ